MKLNIGTGEFRPGFQKGANKTGRHGHRSGAVEGVFHGNFCSAKQAANLIVERWFVAIVDEPCLEMILHIAADLGCFANKRNIYSRQVAGIADA